MAINDNPRIQRMLKAKRLLLSNRQTVAVVAKKTGVTTKTIYMWAIKYGWDLSENKPNANLRKQAKDMYLNDGLEGGEIARQLGISKKTMSQWVQKNSWNILRANNITVMLKEPLTIDVDKFKRYLIKSEDLFADTMIALIDDYIKKPPEPPG